MKEEEQKNFFGNLYSPYAVTTEDTMADWYEAYQSDLDKYLVIDGRTYSRIIHRCEFYAYEFPTMLVSFESTAELRIKDVLIDEYGREFVVKAFETVRFSGDIPEWYLKVSNIAIQGKDYSIGNYLSKKCCT